MPSPGEASEKWAKKWGGEQATWIQIGTLAPEICILTGFAGDVNANCPWGTTMF